MKSLVIFAILLTSYLAAARIDVIKYEPYEPRWGFGSLKGIEERSDINKDIQDFIDLVPRDKIEGVVRTWIDTDAEVKSNWEYANTDNVKQRILDIEQSPEFITIRQQLESKHVDVARFANMVHDILGMQHITRGTTRANVGLRGLLDEVRPIIPMTKIKLLAAKKYVLSSQFRGLVSLVLSGDFKSAANILKNSPQVLSFIDDAGKNGVDMNAIYDFLNSFSIVFKDFIPN